MIKNLKILSILKQRINQHQPALVKDVILFGSQVKGQANNKSDFDVLIITLNKIDWRTKKLIRDICYELSLENEIFIDSKIVSDYELKNNFWGKHPLYTDALNQGVYAR